MLSSIHPLGERARSNRWQLTVAGFTIGALVFGAMLGSMAAALGSVAFGVPPSPVWSAAIVMVAGAADLAGIRVPWVHRQVNERWIEAYRGWVYGVGFGAQLGVGFATYVVTWAVPALVAVLALSGDVGLGTGTGALFGLGRAVPLLAAGWIDRPSRLPRFHAGMAALARPVHITAGAVMLATGSLMWMVAA